MAIAGAAPLLLTAALAFTYDPLIGEVTTPAKYGHNGVMVAIVLAALSTALLRGRRGVPTEGLQHESPGSVVNRCGPLTEDGNEITVNPSARHPSVR